MKKLRITGLIFVLIISVLITFFLSNKIGKSVENVATELYQKISGKKPQHFQYDSLGVPVVVYEGKLGKQYNPVSIAEHAISWADGRDSVTNSRFYACIEWLMNNYTVLNDSSIIYLDYFDWPSFGMTSPWRSAMNQGRAMQAFLKAYEKTGDTLYLNLAIKSMNTLHTEVRVGGVTYVDSTGYWYEEYADDNVQESRVLNGMIVVLQALSDFHKATNNKNALFLFNKGVNSVKSTLHSYDNNGNSNYDVLGKPASPWYHKFHIELLDRLYTETQDPIFNKYKQRWLKYKEPSYLLNLIRKPSNIGVFTNFSIFIGVFTFISVLSYIFRIGKRKPKFDA